MRTKLFLAGATALTAFFAATAPASARPAICDSLENAGLTNTTEYTSNCSVTIPEPSIVTGCLVMGAAMLTKKVAKSK